MPHAGHDRLKGWLIGKARVLRFPRYRVCMTAAMLVLDPIFEADLQPELYAYRAGRNAQQAVIEVEELLFRGQRPGSPPRRRRRA
jgi:hypothetical protein